MTSQQERSIFLQAIEIASSEERTEYLHEACGSNERLRAEIEALLRAHDKPRGLLDAPDFHSPTIDQPIQECAGTVIGPYKLLEQIGEGGFGVVFLAEQERPVRRRVALKIVKPGMDTRQVIARFEAERQALAVMDHPHIAKVFDAGATENGRPYFVMELVQGVPITEYCDQCNLTTRERVELFTTVCHAVQHAHQRGVIHRDIKPTNVLVAMQDGRPAPKIIDFGVAKAVGQRLTEHTLTTAFAQMVGSPLYMSPEQAELSPLGVDTRSDIYSLGVMLYELLAGTTPFDKDRLHAAGYDELRRIIREEEPPRPSARISTLAADLATTVADHRRTDARRLSQQVRGELDWIVMKCLEKDRNRRYETPNSLARDIERYLDDEPVQACPPSASYRFRKFARRNKTLLAAGGAITGALVIGLGLSTWMYFRERAAVAVAKANERRATTESARAKAVSALLQENRIQLGELLTREQRAVLRPEDAQRLSMDAAARTEEARRQIRQAIEAYGQVAIDYPDDFERRAEATRGFAEILNVCAAAPGFSGEVDELNRRLKEELPKLAAAFSDDNEYQRRTANIYSLWFNELVPHTAYMSTAEYALSESIAIIEKLLHSNPNQPSLWLYLANSYVWLGDIRERSGQSKDFIAAYERAIQIYDQHATEIAAEIAADATTKESLRITGDYIPLAYFLARTHHEHESAELIRQAALHAKRVTDPVASVSTLVGIALVQLRLGDVAGFRETCQAVADVPVADADDLTKVRSILPCCCGPDPLDDMSLFVKRAEELVANNSLGQRHVVLYVSGAALFRAGQYDRAAERLEESIATYPSEPAPGHDVINYQRLFLAMTKWKLGQREEARRLLAEALPAIEKELRSPSCWWIYRLGLELLRSEAKTLIESKEANEAVENRNELVSSPSNANSTPTKPATTANGQPTTDD